MKKLLTVTSICVNLLVLSSVPSIALVYDGTYTDMYLKQNTFPSGLMEEQVFLDMAQSTTIIGHVGGQASSLLVTFSSTTDTLDSANGFANIKAVDGYINNITITAPGYWFEDLIFSLNMSKNNNDLTVTAKDKSGGIDTFAGWVALGSWVDGDNRILVLSDPGTLMQSVTITSLMGIKSIGGGIDQLKQTEISGLTPIPEPSTMMLLGAGLSGLAVVGRRKMK